MAIRLVKAFGSTPEGWMRLQFQYDAAQVEEPARKIKVKTQWYIANHLSVKRLFFDCKHHRADNVDGMQRLAWRTVKNLDLILPRFPSLCRL